MTSDLPTQLQRLIIEPLECRIAPATLPLLSIADSALTATFTDSDGDVVTLNISGKSGTVAFLDGGGNSVDDGEDIASVEIAGASSDFTLSYSFDVAGGAGNTVLMGAITSDRAINGVYSIPLTSTTGKFSLNSFTGPGFSAGGGISADNLVGNADGVGIEIASLAKGRTLNFRDGVAADVLINGAFGGAINVGGDVQASSFWGILGATATTAQISVFGDFLGDTEFTGAFSGDVIIGGDASGEWTFAGGVNTGASLNAELWSNLQTPKNFAGQLIATSNDVTMTVGGNLMGTAMLSVQGLLTLNVTQSVKAGAFIGATSDITATVGGSVAGNWNGSLDVTLTVAGSMSGAIISSGSATNVNVTGSVSKTMLRSDSDLTMTVGGKVDASTLYAADGLTLDVAGNVTKSNLEGSDADSTITIGGGLTSSRVTSGSEDLTLNVTGSISKSTVSSLESGISMTVGGSISSSQVTSNGLLTAQVAGSVTSSNLSSIASSFTVGVGKDMVGSRFEAASIMTVNVGGSMKTSSISGDEGTRVFLDVTKDVTSSQVTGLDCRVTMNVGGNATGLNVTTDNFVTIAVAGNLSTSQLNSGSDLQLSVGGNVSSSTMTSNESSITLSVGGNFTKSSLIADEDIIATVGGSVSGYINSYDSTVTLTVAGDVAGSVLAGDIIIADIGSLSGAFRSDILDLEVSGNVSAKARLQAVTVDDRNANFVGFHVGGSFAGILNVVDFDSDVAGGSTLVDGQVLASAQFNIGRNFGGTADESFTFGDDFLGLLSIGGNLDANLTFGGDVNTISVGGIIGVSGAVNTITIAGKLTYLSSSSLFDATDALTGIFKNGAGTTTGSLATTGGFKFVSPAV